MSYKEGDIVDYPDGSYDVLKNNQWVTVKPNTSGKITQREAQQATAPMRGLDEGLMSVVSGIPAMIAGGVAGAGSLLLNQDPQKAEGLMSTVSDYISYKPKTPEGMQSLQNIGNVAGKIGSAINYPISGLAGLADLAAGKGMQYAGGTVKSVQDIGLGKTAGQQAIASGGSPGMATLYETVPTALTEIAALKGIQSFRGQQPLIAGGVPTKNLRTRLNELGLDYGDLTQQAKQNIPSKALPILLGGSAEKRVSNQALIDQLKTGGRSNALATLQLVDGKTAPYPAGKEAIKQGFREGVVQGIRTATPESKIKMRKMIDIMRKTKKNERSALDVRPSDIAGNAVTDRITFIRDKSLNAADELDRMVKGSLGVTAIDPSGVVDALKKSLAKLDINLPKQGTGKPMLDFKDSLISEDPTSQRVIQSVLNLLAQGGTPNALRAHKIKKQLDRMLDFKKKSAEGLTDAGKGVAMDIRASLNNAVRDVSPDYARVNDTMYKALTALDSVDGATGSIDIFSRNANTRIGTNVRKLMSNYASRGELETALSSLDDVATQLGGKFGDDVKDLAFMANVLDERFGTMNKTSLSGVIGQAVQQGVDQGITSAARRKAAETAGKAADKIRGVNDFNAYESLIELLK